MKIYVGDGNSRFISLDTSDRKKKPSPQNGNNVQESVSISDHKMRESFSQHEQRQEESTGTTEDENIDNGNISTEGTETASGSDEVNI